MTRIQVRNMTRGSITFVEVSNRIRRPIEKGETLKANADGRLIRSLRGRSIATALEDQEGNRVKVQLW